MHIATAWKMQNDVISCFPALPFEISWWRSLRTDSIVVFVGFIQQTATMVSSDLQSMQMALTASCNAQTMVTRFGELSRDLMLVIMAETIAHKIHPISVTFWNFTTVL